MRKFLSFTLACMAFVALPFTAAHAQNDAPDKKPAFLETLAAQGAQLRYLGNDGGLDGWIVIMRGQEQFFYVTPDGESAVTGILLDKDGRNLSLKQVYELQQNSDVNALDFFADAENFEEQQDQQTQSPDFSQDFKTPAEQLFTQVEQTNWIPLGQPGAPVVYAFIDTQCPHCHDFINELRHKNYLKNGTVQVRIIPVGLRPETKAQAAFLLALPNPQDRFFKHLDGDQDALPISQGLNEQGVERNMAIMQSWKLSGTPLIIYRGKNEQVKIVEGRPRDVKGLIKDLAAPAAQ